MALPAGSHTCLGNSVAWLAASLSLCGWLAGYLWPLHFWLAGCGQLPAAAG